MSQTYLINIDQIENENFTTIHQCELCNKTLKYAETSIMPKAGTRMLNKRDHRSIWVTGLPPILYIKDLFYTLQIANSDNLLRVMLFRHPEAIGLATWGVAELTFVSQQAAEEVMGVLQAIQAYAKYNSSYSLFLDSDIKAMWSNPFVDISLQIRQHTRIIKIKNIPLTVNVISIIMQIEKYGARVQRIRRYSTHCFVVLHEICNDIPKYLTFNSIKSRVYKAQRADNDFTPKIRKGQLLLGQLNAQDREALTKVIAAGAAFPCKKDAIVKNLQAEVLNKARRLINHSRAPLSHSRKDTYLLHPEPEKKPRLPFPYTQGSLVDQTLEQQMQNAIGFINQTGHSNVYQNPYSNSFFPPPTS